MPPMQQPEDPDPERDIIQADRKAPRRAVVAASGLVVGAGEMDRVHRSGADSSAVPPQALHHPPALCHRLHLPELRQTVGPDMIRSSSAPWRDGRMRGILRKTKKALAFRERAWYNTVRGSWVAPYESVIAGQKR